MAVSTTEPPPAPQGDTAEALREQWQRERARREMTLSSIRSHLQEQPSPRSIRACARRWSTDIANLAETVIAERKNQETAE